MTISLLLGRISLLVWADWAFNNLGIPIVALIFYE
ncbi:hypothetical protein ERO13_D01G154100v2 [Gossypium hirsutum]|uniref:Uncharacterized protein n=2 Tax=Gossypium TaxID=3633 RepID=A0A5D2MB78_GOSTO|nr:hypothetical protein ERO13_D01G154100v2 [Gossypium hirsutum]TYG83821.1 hypothetical protein ES288_D01G198800v1 [Gossypium darwinii]TYH88631.1 hypothetical protein ES332_D01G201000v1 [Gossypium tomentosum]